MDRACRGQTRRDPRCGTGPAADRPTHRVGVRRADGVVVGSSAHQRGAGLGRPLTDVSVCTTIAAPDGPASLTAADDIAGYDREFARRSRVTPRPTAAGDVVQRRRPAGDTGPAAARADWDCTGESGQQGQPVGPAPARCCGRAAADWTRRRTRAAPSDARRRSSSTGPRRRHPSLAFPRRGPDSTRGGRCTGRCATRA